MAHEIEGNYAFFGSNKPAWHGLGTVLKDAPTIDDAWKLAYPHELIECEVKAFIGDQSESIPDKKAIFRDDGKYIATVGIDYGLIQPYKVFDSYRDLIESKKVELEAGGSLRDGKRMWALAKLTNDGTREVLNNDAVNGYLLMHTSFDGSLSHGIKFVATRVVCANTLAVAIGESGSYIKLKHTSRIEERLDQVMKAVNTASKTFDHSIASYQALAKKKMTYKQMCEYVMNHFVTEEKRESEEKISTKTINTVKYVIDLLDSQKGLELVPAMKGTAWQAYNAISQYYTHDYGNNEDNRLNGQWFGQSAKMNQAALNEALAH